MLAPSVQIACPLCGSSDPADYTVLYPAYVPKGSLSKEVFSARRLPDKIHYQLVKCNNDELVRSTPVFPNEVIATFYRKSVLSYEDEIANLITTYISELEKVLSKLDKNAAILEIGCGSGFLLSALKKRGFTNVHGIEPSSQATKLASPSIRKNIIVDVFSKKALKGKKFDLICMFQTLDHLPELNTFLSDCYDSLHQHGYILSYHHNVEFWLRKVLGEKHPIIDIEHLTLFSPKTTAALFEKNGFLTKFLTSPFNTMSLAHLFWLLPLPKSLKLFCVNTLKRLPLINLTFRLELGNVAITAQKPGL